VTIPSDPGGLELHKSTLERPSGDPPGRPTTVWWVASGLLVVVIATVAYLGIGRRQPPATPKSVTRPPVAVTPPPSLGGQGDEQIAVPPLDQSDPLVRRLVGALSGSPLVTTWLTTNGLIRNVTVIVSNIAEGATPARHLTALRPTHGFSVVERAGATYLDPRSGDRYDAIAGAVASVDPAGIARLYATLKPRVAEAYRELGYPERSFDRTLEQAIVLLLSTPVVDGAVRLRPKGIGYAFFDERLEGLTAAQKQLLRMGPRNERIIQGRLREMALAVGMRPGDLP
jgi:hypothetical protein